MDFPPIMGEKNRNIESWKQRLFRLKTDSSWNKGMLQPETRPHFTISLDFFFENAISLSIETSFIWPCLLRENLFWGIEGPIPLCWSLQRGFWLKKASQKINVSIGVPSDLMIPFDFDWRSRLAWNAILFDENPEASPRPSTKEVTGILTLDEGDS